MYLVKYLGNISFSEIWRHFLDIIFIARSTVLIRKDVFVQFDFHFFLNYERCMVGSEEKKKAFLVLFYKKKSLM